MIRHDENGLVYYQFRSVPADRVLHAVFTRLGGVSSAPFSSLNLSLSVPDQPKAVHENRRRFYHALGVDPNSAARTVQVHGARAAAVGPADVAVTQRSTDGLVTVTPGLPLVMAFADCTPILLYDPVRAAVGIAHAGWRGTAAGICQATVRQMVKSFGCRPGDILAAIGPAIGPCCYEVGLDVFEVIAEAFGRTAGFFREAPARPGTGTATRLYFDQWAANEAALRQVGVERFEHARMCTACHVDEFYSHRAENGRTGRFGAIIMLCD